MRTTEANASVRAQEGGSEAPLAGRARFVRLLGAWALLLLAAPGILWPEGSAVLATLAIAAWALVVRHPGRRAFWIEWLAAGIGLSATCIWSVKVLWITLLAVAIVPAAYVGVAGVVLRRLQPRLPFWLATALAWVGLETLRYFVEPPFGWGWMRLGHHASHVGWLAGSARVWGTAGISFVLASLGGALARALAIRATSAATAATPPRQAARTAHALAPALGPLALAVGFGLAFSPPPTETGPRVMLVQPALEQRRKMTSPAPEELLRECVELTQRGLDDAAKHSERAPDIVAWGESMLPFSLMDEALEADFDRGARSVPWAAIPLQRVDIDGYRSIERDVIGGLLLAPGARRILPTGANFVTGADLQAVKDGAIRRWNVVVAWDASGKRIGWGGKLHLVPGGEFLCGLERLEIVRTLANDLANYIPDFVAPDHTSVLEFQRTQVAPGGGGGASSAPAWRASVSVCFDNAFEDPYTSVLRAGPVDFHLVCSNEAWYEESFEYDQMLAFSRLIAIATGRSMVRATNAGVSVVLDPSGRELARLSVDGRDRMVAGTLRADVPVPTEAARASRTPFVVLERAWLALWIGLPLLLSFLPRRRSVTDAG